MFLRYLAGLMVGMGVALTAVAAINTHIDTQNLFDAATIERDAFIKKLVRRLREGGEPLADVGYYRGYYRTLKRELAETTASDCYVIGSSHVMMLDLTTLPYLAGKCREAINLGVIGGGYGDIIAFLGILATKARNVTAFVEINPWTFRRDADNRYLFILDAFEAGLVTLGLAPQGGSASLASAQLLGTRFSLRYLAHNLRFLWYSRFQAAPAETNDVQSSPEQTLATPEIRPAAAAPGVNAILPSGRRAMAPNHVPLAESKIDRKGFRLSGQVVDPDVARDLEKALRAFIARGNRVEILLTPYHPVIWTCQVAQECDVLNAVDRAATKLAHDLGVTVVGSLNPKDIGATSRDFEDGHHLTAAAAGDLSRLVRRP